MEKSYQDNMQFHDENSRRASYYLEHIKNEDLKLEITTLAGPDGHLFGSITPIVVATLWKNRH